MEIINFLFGWLVKPELLQTPLDNLICIIEFFVIVPIAIRIVMYVKDTIYELKNRRNKSNE